MSMTRADMYQTVRDALHNARNGAQLQITGEYYHRAVDVLAALEEEEREAELKAAKYDAVVDALHVCDGGRYRNDTIESVVMAARRVATPPAPTAAECPARNAMKAIIDFGLYLPDKCREDGCTCRVCAAHAALAAPCECQRLREELAAAKSEIARLTAARDTEVGYRRQQFEDIAAELRQAVDAMRPFEEYFRDIRKRNRYPTDAEYVIVAGFVAAYDAKHGEVGKPDAPSPEYSECPNCHVTLYRSATDTHERRHEIREGGEVQR